MKRILLAVPALFLAAPAFAAPGLATIRVTASPDREVSALVRTAHALEATPGVTNVAIDLGRDEVHATLTDASEESLRVALREVGLLPGHATRQVVAAADRTEAP